MQRDSIRQLGKYIRKSGDKSVTALKRVQKKVIKTERTRDIFDYAVPFVMHFPVLHTRPTIILDIIFTPPPLSLLGCCADCVCPIAERFWGGTSEYPLLYLPSSGTLSVWVDGIRITNYILDGLTVTLGVATTSTTKVLINYVYQYDDCDQGVE